MDQNASGGEYSFLLALIALVLTTSFVYRAECRASYAHLWLFNHPSKINDTIVSFMMFIIPIFFS